MAFIDGILESSTLQDELNNINSDIKRIDKKIIELETTRKSINCKQDIKTIYNLKEIEKMKQKSNYVKTNNLWDRLSKEKKQFLINKYIDEIEITVDKNYNVKIKNILFNKNEIANIGYMFRNNCFDLIINTDEKDLILSNYKSMDETNKYISNLRKFYNIKTTEITNNIFDITKLESDIIQIIPQEKNSKFEKNKYTILQIEA